MEDNNTNTQKNSKVKSVVVISTAMLTFITFWKAAAIVLCDFGSSAFYAGGIAYNAFGPAFPWYILGVSFFSGLLLMMYLESCSMFTRSGVFPVVSAGLGEKAAQLAASALLFDMALTGPISGLSAGNYLIGLINSTLATFKIDFALNPEMFSMIFAAAVVIYFWYQNVKGIEDSSEKSAKIIKLSLIICGILFLWSGITLALRGTITLPPLKPQLTKEAMGWAANIPFMHKVGYFGVLIALGHSVLALSGLETLAQVFRELEYPKIQNLKKTAMIIFVFAVVFTGGLTFLASVIIAPQDMAKYSDNLISGLAMSLTGPTILKLILQAAVVFAGGLMLCGAVNTSIIGANGTMNRIAEAGILTDWFRKIHKRYGTTYHIINTICITQLIVIFLSRGKVYLIGQAYAFGVLWSFVFEMVSIVVLRFTKREQKREFKMPFNIKFDHFYIPLGAIVVGAIVVSLAGINLLTKKVATISGVSFGLILFTIFYISSRLNAKKANIMFEEGPREKLNETQVPELSAALANLPYKENILVTVKDANKLYHLEKVLTDLKDTEVNIIVLYARPLDNWNAGKDREAVSIDYKELFTQVILKAENFGRQVHPIMVNSNDFFAAAAQTAYTAKAQKIVMGVSGTYGANEQMEYMVMAWAALPQKYPITAEILWPGREVSFKF